MLFEQYCEIMRTHGIGELFFNYENENYYLRITCSEFDLNYSISDEHDLYASFLDFEELISAPLFKGKTLGEIWDNIKITYIDGTNDAADYNYKEYSFNYQKWKTERGNLIWRHFLSVKESLYYQMKYAFLPAIIWSALSTLFPLLKLSNWNTVLLFGGCAVFALMLAFFVSLKNRVVYHYAITDKRIIVYKGIEVETTYDNIKKIKLKKFRFKKGYGTIKIYVKKGLSLNYHIVNVPEVKNVYSIILKNMKN